MALKPTIYKFQIAITDLNNDYYDSLNLTVAQHPSETAERMVARVMAFCLHAADDPDNLLAFTKGLSSIDEPDIWLRGLDDQLHLSIDVGEPSFERMKKACRLAATSYVYTFNSKSNVWWKQSQPTFSTLPVNVVQLPYDSIQAIAKELTRTIELSITLSANSAYIAAPNAQIEMDWLYLQRL